MTETKHYDGSYCPKCLSDNVEIHDSDHDFGYLLLRIKCLDCDCRYYSELGVSKGKLDFIEVELDD